MEKTAGQFKANGAQFSDQLTQMARDDTDTVLRELGSGPDGLSTAQAQSSMKKYGPNEIASEKPKSVLARLKDNVKNPLVILLALLGAVSYAPAICGRR